MEEALQEADDFWQQRLSAKEWNELPSKAREAMRYIIGAEIMRNKTESIDVFEPEGKSIEGIAFTSGVREALSSGAKKAAGVVKNAGKKIVSGSGKVASKAKDAVRKVYSKAKQAFKAAKSRFKKVVSWVREQVSKLKDYLGKLKDGLGSLGEASDFQSKAQKEVKKAKKIGRKMSDCPADSVSKRGSSLLENTNKADSELEDKSQTARELRRKAKEREAELKGKIRDAKKRKRQAEQEYEERKERLKKAEEEISGVETVHERAASLQSQGISGMDERVESLPDTHGINEVMDILEIGGFFDALTSAASKLLNFFKGLYKKVASWVKKAAKWIRKKAEAVFSKFISGFSSLKEIISGLTDRFKRNESKVKELAGKDHPKAKEFANKQAKKLDEYAKEINDMSKKIDKGKQIKAKANKAGLESQRVEGISSITLGTIAMIAVIGAAVTFIYTMVKTRMEANKMKKKMDEDFGDMKDIEGQLDMDGELPEGEMPESEVPEDEMPGEDVPEGEIPEGETPYRLPDEDQKGFEPGEQTLPGEDYDSPSVPSDEEIAPPEATLPGEKGEPVLPEDEGLPGKTPGEGEGGEEDEGGNDWILPTALVGGGAAAAAALADEDRGQYRKVDEHDELEDEDEDKNIVEFGV